MSKYINADEFLEKLGTTPEWTGNDSKYPFEVHLALLKIEEYFKCLVHDLATDDVEKIIRCKDCKHYTKTYDGDYCCRLHTDKVGYCDFSVDMKPDDFCSYGEKKEEVKNNVL